MKTLGLSIVVVCVSVIASSGAARADALAGLEAVGVAPAPRSGWMFGASIGRGELNVDVACTTCPKLDALREALSLNAHVGFMVNPRLALVVDGWLVRYKERDNLRFADSSDHLIVESSLLAGAQVWATRRIWLRAGLGLAWHETDLEYPVAARPVPAGKRPGGSPPVTTSDDLGPAAGVALGLEVARTPGFGFELILRTGGARHTGGVDVGVTAIALGGTWY